MSYKMNNNSTEQTEQIAGNIQTAIFTSEDKGFQAKKYFFTYHININESFEQAFSKLKLLESICEKYIWAEEYGKSGKTPHIQGGFILESKMRAKTISDNFFKNGVSLFKLKNWNGCFKYCQKEGNNIKTNCKIARPLKKLPCDDINNRFWWQNQILDILKGEPDDRIIYWYYGDGGVGKTTFAKHIHRNHEDVIVLGGKSADMKNGIIEFMKNNDNETPRIIIINLPKSFNTEYLSYTGIEECKDMFFYSGKYEGKMVDGNEPHFIIFGNDPPDESKMTEGRWNIINVMT